MTTPDHATPELRKQRGQGRRRLIKNTRWNKAMRNPVFAFVVDILGILATAMVLSLLIKAFIIRSFYIPSGSMETTLLINDRIVVNELVPNIVPLERGDVVVFRDPGGWLGPIATKQIPWYTQVSDFVLSAFGVTAPDSDVHLVKRVIGIPGDHVKCCTAKGKLTINGVAITEPYVIKDATPSDITFNVTVPRDSYWVMGDNRNNSEDSRYHLDLPSKGFVAKQYVVGRAFLVTWPFPHFKWLDNYGDVFKNVPNK